MRRFSTEMCRFLFFKITVLARIYAKNGSYNHTPLVQ